MNPPQAPCVPQGLAPSPMLLHPSAAAATTATRPTTTAAAELPKRRRISRPKVKSGCITCKRRHVKCDEMKPTCGRCAKAYVECLGYHQPTAAGEDGRKKRQRRPDAPVRALLPRPPPPQPSATSSPLPSPSLYDDRRTSVGSNGSTVYALSPGPSPSPSPSPSPLPAPPRLPSSPWPSSSPSSPSPSSSSSSSPSSCADADDEADAVYLDLFHSHLARALAGPVPSRFWSRTVPREAGRDGCVRSAVLAIAALAASMMLREDDNDDDNDDGNDGNNGGRHHYHHRRLGMTHGAAVWDRHHRAAIAHYTEAVSAFRGRVGGGGGGGAVACCPPRSVLIATVLFVTYELLQGNDEAADGLVTSGINLLGGSLGILDAGGGGDKRRSTGGIGSAARAGGTPPVLLLPGAGAGPGSQLFNEIYDENYGIGSRSGDGGLGYCDYFFSQGSKHDDSYDDNGDLDGMHEIQHILPRLSVLGGMSAFFPRQQDERAVALLRTTPRSEFPPPQGRVDMEQLASMWSDFSTRCLIWARRQAWLGHGYVRGGASSSTLAAEEDPASLLAVQGEFKALLSRWRAVLAEYQAIVAATSAEDMFCSYTSSRSSEYPLLGLQSPWNSDSLSGSAPEQQSEAMHALAVMELQVVFCDTFITGCLDPTTLTYDALAGNFAEMVSLARGVLCLRQQQQQHQQQEPEDQQQDLASLGFTLDAGLVAPMAFAAAQCRDRALRMEAVELLCLGERREGAHDARAQAAGLLALVGLEEVDGGRGAALPPLESRYVWSGARWDAEGARLVAQFTRVVPDGLGDAVLREMALEL
ncbi:hypothetical protein RB601_000777 [Gaeumannomyces tritici]